MASEIRVNQIQSRTGVSTISFTETGPIISGVTTITGDLDVTGLVSYDDVTNIDSVGVVTARDGLHVTGGNVAIGHNNPQTKLDLLVGGSSGGINIHNNATGSAFYQLSTTANSYKVESIGSDLRIYDNTSTAERLRITSGGSVAIGVNSPSDKLHVGGNNAFIRVDRPNGNPGLTLIYNSNNSTRADIDVTTGGDLRFTTNNSTERLRIDSGGRIITGNYSTALDTTAGAITINGDTSGGRLAFRGSTTSAESGIAEMFGYWDTNKVAGIIFTGGTDTSNKDDGQIKFYTSSSGPTVTERVRINQTGCLQVGEPSGTPGEVMQIRKASGDVEVITYAAAGQKTIFNCTGSNRFALERGYNSVFEIQDPNGNGVRSDLRFDGNIILNKNMGELNNSAVQLYRLIGPQNLSLGGGMAILGSQTDTISTKAAKIGTSNNSGTAWFGPYGSIHPGSYTAMFHMKVSNNSNTSTFLRIDVTGPGCTDAGGYGVHRPRALNLAPSHFDNADRYQYVGLDFNFVNPVGSNVIEVRGLNYNNGRGADLYLDHILIVPRIPSHDG